MHPTGEVLERYRPFLDELLNQYRDNIHSVHLVGSAITPDYDPKVSDINSLVVLKEMDLGFLEFLAPLGKRYRKKRISAPLIMTPYYINRSLDVFPVEFLNFHLIHHTVYGEDILSTLSIERGHLRLQIERELKSKLIWLRQSYLSAMGDRTLLLEQLKNTIRGFIPLFRAVVWYFGGDAISSAMEIIKRLTEYTSIDCSIYEKMYLLKLGRLSPSKDELIRYFETYYTTTESLSRVIDELT